MGQCSRCGKKKFLGSFPRRLAVPELRAMVSHWPWHRLQVCPACQEGFDREFRTRLRLLAGDAVAQDGDVSEPVCLMCGNQDPGATYTASARWVDASGAPAATRFRVCQECRGKVLAGQIVSAAELRSAADFQKVLGGQGQVAEDLVQRTEGWSLGGGPGPAGSSQVERGLSPPAAANEAECFWTTAPEAIITAGGTIIRGATLKPDRSGSIRTHLELQWRGGPASSPTAMALRIYRTAAGYVLVRFP